MGLEDAGTSIADYVDWREQASSLQGLAMIAQESRTLEGKAQPQGIQVARVSPSLLAVLGIAPALGRPFTESEATPAEFRGGIS